jgi:hypothetical protein
MKSAYLLTLMCYISDKIEASNILTMDLYIQCILDIQTMQ